MQKNRWRKFVEKLTALPKPPYGQGEGWLHPAQELHPRYRLFGPHYF